MKISLSELKTIIKNILKEANDAPPTHDDMSTNLNLADEYDRYIDEQFGDLGKRNTEIYNLATRLKELGKKSKSFEEWDAGFTGRINSRLGVVGSNINDYDLIKKRFSSDAPDILRNLAEKFQKRLSSAGVSTPPAYKPKPVHVSSLSRPMPPLTKPKPVHKP